MLHLFRFENYELWSPEGPQNVCMVQIELVKGEECWEIIKISLLHPSIQPLEVTETQFVTLFPGGHDIVNNAFEDAAQSEER
ncbi:MAG TPA: hypothetical protein PLZ61_07650 [Candidatus Cryosericum sp.]|nr:hypothetical protein [Candidatus Cryosericum sp.]